MPLDTPTDQPPAGPALGEDAGQAREPNKLKQAFGRLPNDVARDARVSPEALVTLAYRTTIAGTWALGECDLGRKVRSGLGKNVVRRAIAEAVELGLLKRWQLPGAHEGEFGRAQDRLCLPRKVGRIVQRRWFDGSLTVKELAGLLYLRAGTGKGAGTYGRELASRFSWSRPTADKVITALLERGLLDKIEKRQPNGQYRATTYVVPRLSAVALSRSDATAKRPGNGLPGNGSDATAKKPGNGLPGNGSRGNLLTSNAPHAPLTGNPSLPTSSKEEGHYVTRCASDAPTLELEEAEARAWYSSRILGWIFDGSIVEGNWGEEIADLVSPELVERVHRTLPDRELIERVKMAAGGRVHRDILSAAGAYGMRYLAAFLLAKDDDADPVDALGWVLQAISDRIGTRDGEWLNSLQVIGQRIAGEMYGNGDVGRFFAAKGNVRAGAPTHADLTLLSSTSPPLAVEQPSVAPGAMSATTALALNAFVRAVVAMLRATADELPPDEDVYALDDHCNVIRTAHERTEAEPGYCVVVPPERLRHVREEYARGLVDDGLCSLQQANQLADIVLPDDQSMSWEARHGVLCLACCSFRNGTAFDPAAVTPEDTRWAAEQVWEAEQLWGAKQTNAADVTLEDGHGSGKRFTPDYEHVDAAAGEQRTQAAMVARAESPARDNASSA